MNLQEIPAIKPAGVLTHAGDSVDKTIVKYILKGGYFVALFGL
jgi:hypothetical protein